MAAKCVSADNSFGSWRSLILPQIGLLLNNLFFFVEEFRDDTRLREDEREGSSSDSPEFFSSFYFAPTGLNSAVVCPRRAAPDVKVFKAYGLWLDNCKFDYIK
jgi:hypothetical protein